MAKNSAAPSPRQALRNIQLAKKSAIPDHLQVARQLETMIRSEALPPGWRFPATSELVDIWGLNTSRIQRAMSLLVQSGLLERLPRRGTFVSQEVLRPSVGILAGCDLLPESFQFDRSLVFSLKARLFDSGFIPRVYDGFAEPTNAGAERSLAELNYDLRHERFLGVVCISGSTPKKVTGVENLPAATFGIPGPDVDVCLDFEDFYDQSIKWLKEAGCREIAVFRHDKMDQTKASGEPDSTRATHFDRIMDVTFPNENLPWTVDRHAYRVMKGLLDDWKRTNYRPDGILFSDDIQIRGAALALLEEYGPLDVPKLVVLAFEHSEHFYPVPVARYSCRPSDISEALTNTLRARINRDPRSDEKFLVRGTIRPAFR